jgi:hypothetical protein
MKNTLFSLVALIAFFFSTSAQAASSPAPNGGPCKTLPAGTLVMLETTEKISSDAVTVGKILIFRVRTHVVVDGETVIATGAIAIGRVKSISAATYNLPEEITVEVTYAQAVDGQQVALNGAEQTYKGRFPRESVAVEPGQMITGTSMNNISIKI